MKRNRTRDIIIGLMLILIIAISGTYAFNQLNQAAFNPDLVDVFPGGRIHDVFEGGRVGTGANSQDMFGRRNKNVFAENFGDVPIGVRVQFYEFVSVQGEAIDNATGQQMNLNDVGTWNVVRFNADMTRQGNVLTEGTSAFIGSMGIQWQLGHLPGESQKWYMPTFNRVNRLLGTTHLLDLTDDQTHSVFNVPDVYRFSDTSGRAIDAIAAGWAGNIYGGYDEGYYGHQNVGSILDWQDTIVNPSHMLTSFRGQTGRPQHPGTFDYWGADDTEEGVLWYVAPDGRLTYDPEYEMEARQTLPAAATRVMSMYQWIEDDMPRGNFWVHDETSPQGWFYWVGEYEREGYPQYGMLPSRTATSLLLRQTTLPALPSLEYVIHVNADFFTANSVPLNSMSDNARAIFTGVLPDDDDNGYENGYDNGYNNGTEPYDPIEP